MAEPLTGWHAGGALASPVLQNQTQNTCSLSRSLSIISLMVSMEEHVALLGLVFSTTVNKT